MDKSKNSVSENIAAIALMIPFIGVAIAWDGYTLAVLWRWFIVPVFGLTSLSVPAAIGIVLVASLLTKQYIPSDKDESRWLFLVRPFFESAIVLLVGWIVLKFI